MRVALYYNNKDVRIEDAPVPKVGRGEILMRVRASGICGSDVMEWYRMGKTPRVLGHEVAGEIVGVGPGVTEFQKGERISASHHVPCYHCHHCTLGHHTLCDTLRTTNFDPGGFAEFVRLPEINCRRGIYRLPPSLSFEEATFIEPLACVVRGQRKAGIPHKEQTVFVIGAGTSGILHVALAKASGVRRVVACDFVDFRLEAAKRSGADHVLLVADDLPARLRQVNEGRLADIVITCVGSREAILESFECAERGGTILFFALHKPDEMISLPMNEIFWKRGLTLMSSYAASPEDYRESLNLIASRQIQVAPLMTHHLGLSEIGKGFEIVTKGANSIKVIIDPTQ